MIKKKYLYETVIDNKTGFSRLGLNFSFSKIELFSKVKENFYLYKTLIAVILSGSSLAAVFLFNWIFVFILIPSIFLAVANFSEDYRMIKLKEDFEENGIF
ncbi:MAG: hypothetical protein PHD80_01235 [Candidatus ainarchaeum sp.]|nr:hypothetical protein [Candidatus ainarchaeum sp.]